ncbi:MAG: MATE family efflux transporter, partial [Candidatus Cryptobacteroides sp.]|nr:MATE family efflux transporter [Candidatus Cryptobacteroides sp.]
MASGKDILLGRIRSGEGLSFGQQLKLSLILSYPAILAQLSSVMMQYIDASMVGHLGPAAGASIGLVSTCLWLFGGFGMAVTSGFSVQVAHLVGANDFSGARSVLRQALVCVLGFSLFLAVTGMGISPFLPHWLGGGEDITSDATGYFFIMTLFMPAMIMDWTCAAILQASGNMKVPSILSIGMCVLDVVF